MAAYVIADVHVDDVETYSQYSARVPATLTPYGGRFAVRGGAITRAEGGWKPSRIVMLEFPDMARLKAWYNGPEYQAILQQRLDSATTSMIFVEGA